MYTLQLLGGRSFLFRVFRTRSGEEEERKRRRKKREREEGGAFLPPLLGILAYIFVSRCLSFGRFRSAVAGSALSCHLSTGRPPHGLAGARREDVAAASTTFVAAALLLPSAVITCCANGFVAPSPALLVTTEAPRIVVVPVGPLTFLRRECVCVRAGATSGVAFARREKKRLSTCAGNKRLFAG